MRLGHLNFRMRITAGFAAILLLFVMGLGMGVLGMNKISTMMDLSDKTNQLVKEMFQAREHEKDYLIEKETQSMKGLNQNISNLRKLITDIESEGGDNPLFSGLTLVNNLV